MGALDGMTQEKWDALGVEQRAQLRDLSGLSPQLVGLEGWRVEVVRLDGTRARFIVGRSTGWRPCSLERARRTSTGGMAADQKYRSVRKLYHT